MQEMYIKHNLFIKDFKKFEDDDPHLGKLKDLKFVHPMDWWSGLNWDIPGIYILTGGRQIGKSTSTKLLIKHVLENKIFLPPNVFYLPCDEIDDHHHLTRMIRLFLDGLSSSEKNKFLIIIDEVTFVKDWDKSIKALADDGSLTNGFCILTGSDSVILKDAASRFPGRRGNADVIDFHIYPLSFKEYVGLTSPDLLNKPEEQILKLMESFELYQKCGGYLRAINELHLFGEIKKATYLTFEQWIRGDFERRGKNINTLEHLLKVIVGSSGTQVTYSALANKMGRVVKETVIDYINLLERMDVIFILQAFDQNTKMGFPKKARKIHFCDPFILDTVERWLVSERFIEQRDNSALKAELTVASNFHRAFPTYYIKSDGEIDVVYVTQKTFIPVEVKWTNQIRPQDLKQLAKYKNSVILTKNISNGKIGEISAGFLPLYLVCKNPAHGEPVEP